MVGGVLVQAARSAVNPFTLGRFCVGVVYVLNVLPRRVAAPVAAAGSSLFVTLFLTAVMLVGAVTSSAVGPESAGASLAGAPFTETGCEEYSDSVVRLYQAGLDRAPDRGGFEFWLDAYTGGQWTFARMAEFFVTSDEFQTAYGELSDIDFVRQLYRNVLGREGEANGVEFWSMEMVKGMTRPVVLMRFAESPENITKTGTAPPAFGPFNNGWTQAWTCTTGTSARVVSVTDGDTMTVEFNGVNERVRLIGINAPEAGECLAAEATSELRNLTVGTTVRLVIDQSNRDDFGRLLRYVFVDDQARGTLFVNEVLVEGGFAIANRYEPDTARAEDLDAAQTRARDAGRGLWSPGACGPPATVDLVISAVNADAPGDDNENKNGEWVTIRSRSGAADLSGFVLKDESASHRYTFPDGFVLGEGASVRVFSGCGSNSETNLYWCNSGSAVWNNSGDTAFLLDPNGNLVAQFSY